jgi:hypothetical protein
MTEVHKPPRRSLALELVLRNLEERQRAEREDMERLAKAGADYSGLGGWKSVMQRLGRYAPGLRDIE